jgi:hypothetical protein
LDKMKSIAVPVTRRSAAKTRRAGHPQTPPDEGIGGLIGAPVRPRPFVAGVPITIKPTPKHRYHVGQRLRLLGGGNYWARNAGTCRIVALMPFEGTALFYRVRSETESFERVVAEADLATVSSIA